MDAKAMETNSFNANRMFFNGFKLDIGEEIGNAITHGVGAALSIAATVIMIVSASVNHKGPLAITGVSIYGASMILLYLTSCLYHALILTKARNVFQRLDHCMIFFLITGTYTPIVLSVIGGWVGWTVWGINVACSVLGITLNAISIKKFNKVSQILYIIMGWSIVIFAYTTIKAIPIPGLLLLLLGGITYTVGTIFYRKKGAKYTHFIWHIFVMLGSVPFFFVVYNLICR
ncbi:MAG: hemolysin III family protein [Lachnospiraceae bacterium]|nr:hemolysin III family protein [Lachnospiraceae bacterium]